MTNPLGRRRLDDARSIGALTAAACILLLTACGDGEGDGVAGTGGGGGCNLDDQTHTGEGTYYDADGSGNCSFEPTPGDLMVAAMNDADYRASAACGACVRLTGPQGTVTVRIVDRCPECAPGDVDLSVQAFTQIAAREAGRVPIRWQYVACNVEGPVVYHFKDGSNEYWTAVQIRNHRTPIARLEYRAADGSFLEPAREDYNYFIEQNGMGAGPYAFRVTDVLGQVVEDSSIPFIEDGDAPGASQFPACSP